MAKIYEDANEQHVRAIMIYKKTAETKAYTDAACTVQFVTKDLKNAFIKGALIQLEDGTLAKATGYSESEGVGTVTYIVPNGVTSTSADIAGLVGLVNP